MNAQVVGRRDVDLVAGGLVESFGLLVVGEQGLPVPDGSTSDG